jgi:hypothetical protein
MLEVRIRHWSQLASGLLARLLHSIFSIVKEQIHCGLAISNFTTRNSQSLCGADRDRTDDLLVANQALSQTELQPQNNFQIFKSKISKLDPGPPEIALRYHTPKWA